MPGLSPSERATFLQLAPPPISLIPTDDKSDPRAAQEAHLTALTLSAKKLAAAVASWREREGERPDDTAHQGETGLPALEKAGKRLAADLASWIARQEKQPIAADKTSSRSLPLTAPSSSTAEPLEERAPVLLLPNDNSLSGMQQRVTLHATTIATERPATPSPDDHYVDALEQLEKHPIQNAKLRAHIFELINAVKAFKATSSKNGPLTELLTVVLKTTFERVSGSEQMNKQKYDDIVNSMQRSRSKTLRHFGGIMLVIGALVIIAFPITAAAIVLSGTAAVAITASTTAAAAGGLIAGGLTSWAGYEFFFRNKPATLITKMKKVNASKTLADLEQHSSCNSP